MYYINLGAVTRTIPETSTAMDKSADLNKQTGTTLLSELHLCKNDKNEPAVYKSEIMFFTQQIFKRNGTDCSTTDIFQRCITDFTGLGVSVYNYS